MKRYEMILRVTMAIESGKLRGEKFKREWISINGGMKGVWRSNEESRDGDEWKVGCCDWKFWISIAWYKKYKSWVLEEEPNYVLEALVWRRGVVEIGMKLGMLRGWVESMKIKEEPTRGIEVASRECLVTSKVLRTCGIYKGLDKKDWWKLVRLYYCSWSKLVSS